MRMLRTYLTFAAVAGLVGFAVAADPGADKKEKKEMSRDELRAAVQQICPVTGNKLGSHGKPVKAKIGKETLFLCCKGCGSGKIKPEHWAAIHANFAKAQGICPVMKNELPDNPKWTIVGGQIIYVCCPPCIKKIEADPEVYLQKVDDLYLASLKGRKEK